ncbi:MAG: hypothetical protein M3N43_07900, partial [Actinomycetota bacterium]|nr:hypothetical protein [Actinomycetota bacterium]
YKESIQLAQPGTAHVEGLRLALARLRHGLGNAFVLTDIAQQKTCHLSQDQMLNALWSSLLETQQLMTDVLPHLGQEER